MTNGKTNLLLAGLLAGVFLFSSQAAAPQGASEPLTLQQQMTVAVQTAAASQQSTTMHQIPDCVLGGWRESKAGQQELNGAFGWTFSTSGDTLTIRRNDGFVSGSLQPNAGHTAWTGNITWGNGMVWNNVQLSFDSCNLVKTNTAWWFSRGMDSDNARLIATQTAYPATAPLQQQAHPASQLGSDVQNQTTDNATAAPADPASQPANDAPPQSDDSAAAAFVNALGNATANGDPNAIQNTLNQQLANIQTAQARTEAARAQQAAQQSQQSNGSANGTNPDCPTAAQLAANPKLACRAR